MTAPYVYDVVEYPAHVVAGMHPDRLFVQGTLFGLSPVPVERCRYLEVGCSTGTNLIAAALTLPDSEFVGFDLSRPAVERGREVAAELGLTNVTLHHADLTAWDPGDRPFDYVAAHGIYSWVPEPVRDGLMALVRRSLGPDGVAYVSYNTYPGCYLRRMLWEMLRFHTAATSDPREKLDRADEFLEFLIAAQDEQNDPPNRAILAEATSVANRTERHLTCHDDLSEVNDPVYFLDFVGHAGRHGLRYLAEAELSRAYTPTFPPAVSDRLDGLHRRDPLLAEQYRDFLRVRRFRNTLLCRADRTPSADPQTKRIPDLAASTSLTPPTGQYDPNPGVPSEFTGDKGVQVSVSDPYSKAALYELARRSPERVPFADLLDVITASGDGSVPADELTPGLAGLLLETAKSGVVSLHSHRPPVAREPGERPIASPLARLEAARGLPVSTLLHTSYHLTDEQSRVLVTHLDGTRTRSELATTLAAAVPGLGTGDVILDGLEATLRKLARAGVLVTRPGS